VSRSEGCRSSKKLSGIVKELLTDMPDVPAKEARGMRIVWAVTLTRLKSHVRAVKGQNKNISFGWRAVEHEGAAAR
jgi:hypothetical protein